MKGIVLKIIFDLFNHHNKTRFFNFLDSTNVTIKRQGIINLRSIDRTKAAVERDKDFRVIFLRLVQTFPLRLLKISK